MIPKFRAWLREDKSMNNVECMNFDFEHVFLSGWRESFNIKDIDLMQSTGLKDKNGVEIFEGDILKCTSGIYTNLGATGTGEYEETIKQVIWKDDSWGTRVISSNLTSKGAEKSGLVISAKYAEVLGNIYENPELLEEIK